MGIFEVLVALVIVSFGVLGMTGLQLAGMKQSTSGFNRSKALMLTENMATRMRLNRDAARAQSYKDFDSTAEVCTAKPDPYCQAYDGGDAQSCSAAQLAAFDMYSVACGDYGTISANAGVFGLLPSGSKLEVSCNDTPCVDDSSYTIRVSWTEGGNASSDSQGARTVQMRLLP